MEKAWLPGDCTAVFYSRCLLQRHTASDQAVFLEDTSGLALGDPGLQAALFTFPFATNMGRRKHLGAVLQHASGSDSINPR